MSQSGDSSYCWCRTLREAGGGDAKCGPCLVRENAAIKARLAAQEHFCAFCHTRWTGEGVTEHCGDCHRKAFAARCQTHGDPLVCLACEAEESARPEWAALPPSSPVSDLEVIVNGQPVTVAAGTVRAVIEEAIRRSGQIGAPVAQWQLRTTEGDIIPHNLTDGTDYELTPGRRLWLNLGPPSSPVASIPECPTHGPMQHIKSEYVCDRCGDPLASSPVAPLSVAETQRLLGSDRPISIGKVPTDPIGMRAIASIVASLKHGAQPLSLHRCKVCGTRWLLWPDAIHGGGWNLLDKYSKPGACCDNAAMGEQIEHLRDIPLTVLPPSSPVADSPTWQPIESAPKHDDVFFWIVPKTADEAPVNTSGKPIFVDFTPHLHRGVYGSWSALSKATHWHPMLSAPCKSCRAIRPATRENIERNAIRPPAGNLLDGR